MILIQSDGRWPSDRNHLGQRSLGKSDQSLRFRTEGANLGISQPEQKKTNHWDDRNDAEDFCFIFLFQGSEVMTKKDDTYNSARCVNT
jgi:hypothetical protein